MSTHTDKQTECYEEKIKLWC